VNAEIARSSLRWKMIETASGTFDWDRHDSVVDHYEDLGVKVLFTIRGSPQWASGSATEDVVPDAGSGVTATFQAWVAEYAEFVTLAVNRYMPGGTFGSQVRHWEVWNEPNLDGFWQPTNDVDQYIYFYTQIRAAILDADPDALVAGGVITAYNAAGAGATEGSDFLASLLAAGPELDVVSIHPYPSNGEPDVHDFNANNFDDIAALRRQLDNAGYTSTRIWVTEWGWSTAAFSTAVQAQFLSDSLNMLQTRYRDLVDVAVYFMDIDTVTYQYGLYTDAFAAKASAATFASFVESLEADSGLDGSEVLTAKGTFIASTSTGLQAVTGLGFQPKALLLFGTPQTSVGFRNGVRFGVGMSDGVTDRSAAWARDDAVATSNTGMRTAAKALVLLGDGTPTVNAECEVESFDQDGFTLDWTDAPSAAWVIHYMAFGGDGITRAVVGDIELGTALGEFKVTEPGFRPAGTVLLFCDQAATSMPHNRTSANGAVAFFDADANLFSLQHHSSDNNAGGAGTTTTSTTDLGMTNRAATLTELHDTGFTINQSSQPGWKSLLFFLAFEGGRWKAGTDTQRTTTGVKATDTGFLPEGVLAMWNQGTATGATAGRSTFAVGASDGVHNGFLWINGVDGDPGNTVENMASESTDLLISSTDYSAGVAQARGAATFADDAFSVTWTAADATARLFGYLAVGTDEQAPTGFGVADCNTLTMDPA
jgi:hypothetical protein